MKQHTTRLIAWVKALFPVRVWMHLLDRNGMLLAAGMSYQALFAVFAAAYVGFSIAGVWLAGDPTTLESLINIVGTAIPGLVGDETGIIHVDDLIAGTTASRGILTATGVIALGGLIWTAIGWVTFSRMAVRAVFGLEKDRRNFFLMKARDLLVALIFGALLVIAAGLSVLTTAALDWTFEQIGLSTAGPGYTFLAQGSGFVLIFVINTVVLAALFRFLSRAAIQWRRLAGGSALGGFAMLLLQIGSSLLAGGATRNPLLATFAVFIGLLLFFRISSIITLTAASWIAVGARDREESLVHISSEEAQRRREEEERAALLLAAEVRVREARSDLESSSWVLRFSATSRLKRAQAELEKVKSDAP
ncbi:membrane protein [Leifsonia sp. AK011]|uniref:YihY/virulence factor BrkB family protein n=1 Tax=Leifsonia sp. AK011 TaxID=2723075 RepID=UPI0015C6CDE0|nr:YihY/virulence factor BrkB family protein [Leifsonia sp. AK011]NYF11142.1 membrane protein [Leifsonia sp. AK011]